MQPNEKMKIDDEVKREIERKIARSVSMQKVFAGTDGEQAMDEIRKWCGFSDDTFKIDPYDHAYNAGRRSVAIFINNCINQDIPKIREALKKASEGARR